MPQIEATEPELLAHHYTEAKQPEKAIPLWQKAGSLALKRMALTEAIAHLNKGLELVAALPPSAERDGSELDLRSLLGTAWIALKGWPAQEVWDSLHPALGLANSLRRNDALLPIFWGLSIHVLSRGGWPSRCAGSRRYRTLPRPIGDADLKIAGHLAAVITYAWLGDPTKSREHANCVLALYSKERHGHLVGILNQDPKTFSLINSAISTWMLGYPEQAVEMINASYDHARQRGHPFDLGFALTCVGAEFFDLLREPDDMMKRVEEGERVGRENSLPFWTECMVPIHSGIALIRKGKAAEGVASLERGLSVWEQGGGRSNSPYCRSGLADGVAQLGDLAAALALVDEAIIQNERPGWEERFYYAETLRIKGWLHVLNGDPAGAERAYLASLDWARQQQAKSWELRTATSYARLMRDQGRVSEAHELLAPVYGWFTEGFDTADLIEAKALLDELT